MSSFEPNKHHLRELLIYVDTGRVSKKNTCCITLFRERFINARVSSFLTKKGREQGKGDTHEPI